MPPEVAARAFDVGVTTKASGSGLGLPLSRALARQHGGELTLANEPEGGCVAELVLPEEARS
jgi:signal transduction histidine kinase